MDPKYTDVDVTLRFGRQKIAAVETRWKAFRGNTAPRPESKP